MPGASWSEVVTAWMEEMFGEKVPDDADDMSRPMWDVYRQTIITAGRQCIARRIEEGFSHVCRCVHNWTPHNDHRCACSQTWVDADVNVYTVEDGKPL